MVTSMLEAIMGVVARSVPTRTHPPPPDSRDVGMHEARIC